MRKVSRGQFSASLAGKFTAGLAALVVAGAAAQPPRAFGAPPNSAANLKGVDGSVRAGDDFYRFADGPWLDATPLPAGRSSFGDGSMLKDLADRRVRDLIQNAAQTASAHDTPAGAGQKIGDYYASLMDTAGIEARGLAPLADQLASIASITDREALSAYLGTTLRLDDGSDTQPDNILGVWIHQPFHDADHYAPHLVQGGLGLQDRDDYLDPSPDKAKGRDAYRVHIAEVLKLVGMADAEARATRVLALEIAIAKAHRPRSDLDDVAKTDNSWSRADFDTKAKGIVWRAYFEAAGLGQQGEFVVWQPTAVTGLSALVAEQPIDVWKDYLTFHLLAHNAVALPRAFGGQAADREAQAVAAVNAALGDAVGKLYVERYSSPQDKAAAVAMTENIRTAYRRRLAAMTWMSPATRQKALAKLAALKIGMGYPDAWIDYAKLDVTPGDPVGNLRRAERFEYERNLGKLAQPVDPAEWAMLPQVFGAVIIFSPNATDFSAALLQPPYFDAAGDAAANYGSAGAAAAHEISHSFDVLGNLYDDGGRLAKWWTAEDTVRYRTVEARMAAQLSGYCPRPGLCLNGKQMVGESIADLTGVQLAYDAYHLSLHGRPDAIKDGLTGDQRFFLAYARRWRKVQTEAALRQQVMTDIHPPGEYRSDVVRNVDAWYAAFGVRPGDKLYLPPSQRVRVW